MATAAGGRRLVLRDLGILLVFAVVVAVLMALSPQAFAKPANLMNVVKQASINGVLAMGMMFVIISGGIDLSIGSIVALSGVIAASLAHPGEHSLAVAVIAPVAVGGVVGALNGVSVAYGGIPPFIVTLASMTIVRGLALIAAHGMPVFNVTKAFEALAASFVLQTVPYLVVYFAVVTAGCGFLLSKTVFGRRVYAVGGNEVAASVSGIDVNAIKIGVYTLSGLLAGFAGLVLASRTISGNPTAGQAYEMDAIAAVIIGGVSMSGGVGKWYGTVIGALFIAVIGNGLDILNVSSYYQLIIKGLIIFFAVLFDIKGKGRR
jgi:ribose/xylose/arabinose/galactoside ABC-type transport system permease subunit